MRLGGISFSASPATFQLHPSFIAFVGTVASALDTPHQSMYVKAFIDYCTCRIGLHLAVGGGQLVLALEWAQGTGLQHVPCAYVLPRNPIYCQTARIMSPVQFMEERVCILFLLASWLAPLLVPSRNKAFVAWTS